jgi:hypothetical protein
MLYRPAMKALDGAPASEYSLANNFELLALGQELGADMASTSPFVERRRASRVLIRIPIKVFGNEPGGPQINASAEAVTVSRFGALLRAPLDPALGTTLEILNALNEEIKQFRVVRVMRTTHEGLFELGVEMLNPATAFWGIPFPSEASIPDS